MVWNEDSANFLRPTTKGQATQGRGLDVRLHPHTSANASATRRLCVGFSRQGVYEARIIGEHFERRSGQSADSKPETPTLDHTEAF